MLRIGAMIGAVLLSSGPALAAGGSLPGEFPGAMSAAPAREPRVMTAQVCGFFAILGCFGSPGEAARWSARSGSGYVINTSSARYPTFRPGFFCVVNGPTSSGNARAIAASWRGIVPDAYVKNSCY